MSNAVTITPSERTPSSWLTIILWALLLAAAAYFLVRGPVRYFQLPTYWNDLSQNYAASRLWLQGRNFADPDNFMAMWRDLGAPIALTVRTRLAPTPGNLVLLAPIAWLCFPTAKLAWLCVLLISFVITVWAMMRASGLRFPGPSAVGFVAFCLALAPFHTGITTTNESILVVALCALGILMASREKDIAAGICFGLACSLKPHMAAFLVLYYLIRFRWRLFAWALTTTAVITLVAVLWLQIRGVSWIHDYLRNLRGFAAQNRIDDFTAANPIRFLLINLQVLFYSFTRSARSANFLAFAGGAVLICAWMYLCFKNRSRQNQTSLLSLGTIAVISLLPVYHRFYDATLLVIPLSWCLSSPPEKLRTLANFILLCMVPFFVPGSALLETLVRQGRIPLSWSNSWCWERFVMPHQTWFLLVLSFLLLGALAKQTADEIPEPMLAATAKKD